MIPTNGRELRCLSAFLQLIYTSNFVSDGSFLKFLRELLLLAPLPTLVCRFFILLLVFLSPLRIPSIYLNFGNRDSLPATGSADLCSGLGILVCKLNRCLLAAVSATEDELTNLRWYMREKRGNSSYSFSIGSKLLIIS